MRAATGRRIRKFYAAVSIIDIEGGHGIALDGRAAKTKAGNALAVPTLRLAELMASEWEGEGEYLDLDALPLTRLASTAIDLGPRDRNAWIEEIAAYLRSDQLCYHAAAPAMLVQRQKREWGPILSWAEHEIGHLCVVDGIVRCEQPDATIAAFTEALAATDDWHLIGIRTACQIAGSAILGFALFRDAFDGQLLFTASRLDERFQAEQWGDDLEARARENSLKAAFMTVSDWFSSLRLISSIP